MENSKNEETSIMIDKTTQRQKEYTFRKDDTKSANDLNDFNENYL